MKINKYMTGYILRLCKKVMIGFESRIKKSD